LPPVKNEKTRTIIFRQQSYLVTNFYGTSFPKILWIFSPTIPGYLDETGNGTGRLAALTLKQINSSYDGTA
jgi:hypothetical protein